MGGGREILGIWFDFRIEKPSETWYLEVFFGFMSIDFKIFRLRRF